MTHEFTDNPVPLPQGLTEELLCEWLEGDLSPARAREVEELVAQDTALMAMCAGARADRASLRGVPDVSAPAWLAARVLGELESDALSTIADGSEFQASPPVSRVVPARESAIARIWRSIGAQRGLAMAACAALLITGAWLASTWLTGSTTPPHVAPDPIAMNVATPPQPGAAPSMHAESTVPAGTQPTADGHDAALAYNDADGAPLESAPTEPEPITLARAGELAREGRLAIVMRAVSVSSACQRLDAIAQRSVAPTSRWVLAGGLPSAMARDVSLAATVIDRHDQRPVLADDDPAASTEPLIRLPSMTPDLPDSLPPTGYVLSVPTTEASLERAIGSLSFQRVVSVEFVELSTPHGMAPELAVRSILWWAGEDWTPRAAIPVIVEPMR